MKVLLDENVHRGLSSFLTKSGHEVKLAPKGFKNSRLFRISVEEKRLLITRDADFSKPPYASSEHFGIVLLRIQPGDLEAQKRAVSELFNSETDFKDKKFILREKGSEAIK